MILLREVLMEMGVSFKSSESKANLMNELPVIGYPCLRIELWDRQGANIASR